ncbi:MAG: o-succinylbenzoate synthase [Bacteroidota bacterium]|nr:o-succinylbenzoate synthase [Bacteroidota bacterium]
MPSRLKATCKKHNLNFNFDARTSRGAMKQHSVWYIQVWHESYPDIVGLGEAAPLPGLSVDDVPNFENKLISTLNNLNIKSIKETLSDLVEFPSIIFALETALNDLKNGGVHKIFDTGFYDGTLQIPINGLIWMGSIENMTKQITDKIDEGFSIIKLKIGGNNFEDELQLLKKIRNEFSLNDLEIRLDANGAFAPEDALLKLNQLSEFEIHSIEQPIRPKQIELMAELIKKSPIPIALDEDLIGIIENKSKEELIKIIGPHYLILKPTLLGGFVHTNEWIEIAENNKIGWWLTSAMESNIGLNAICQFASQFDVNKVHGLGTGKLYNNNINSPLQVSNCFISYNQNSKWDHISNLK